MVDGFNVSAKHVEIGVVQFSSRAHTVIGLSPDAAAIKAAVSAEVEMKADTNTYQGFEQAESVLASGRPPPTAKVRAHLSLAPLHSHLCCTASVPQTPLFILSRR